jgi:subtilisin family serine protease
MLHHRIKPDLVAPGDSLVSVLSNGAAGPSCGTLSMTGTSMATPAAAGIGLLVRQYFMSPSSAFWAGHCNLVNSFCRAFTPSGVLVKAVLLQSGSAMRMFDGGGTNTYDITHDRMLTPAPLPFHATSSSAGSNDVILGAPPDQFQGYGRVTLSNVLPLTGVYLSPHNIHPTALSSHTSSIGVCSLNLFVEDLTVILENGRINYSVQVLSGSKPLK